MPSGKGSKGLASWERLCGGNEHLVTFEELTVFGGSCLYRKCLPVGVTALGKDTNVEKGRVCLQGSEMKPD